MIKLIAALTMLIDHIGVILFPTIYEYRVIGRLSMPLFAYCIARGFYFSNQHGTVKKYIMNMLIFAVASQFPFNLMTNTGFNIGYTWLCSLLLLIIGTRTYDSLWKRIISLSITSFLIFILVGLNIFPVDYGLYGICTSLLFYYLIQKKKENMVNYICVLFITLFYYVLIQKGSILQIISIFSAFILTVSKKYDDKVKLPKRFFYAFYPMHIIVLLSIKTLV